MIILDATTKSLEFVLAQVVSANQLDFSCSYVDITTTTILAGDSNGVSNGTTPVTLVAAPGASTQRQVKFISITNKDTANSDITISINPSSTLRRIFKVTLEPGDNLTFVDTEGFRIHNSLGYEKTTAVNITSIPRADLEAAIFSFQLQ